MMKNIAIIASGTRGDVQPYVALGQGLHAAGYGVRVLTSDDFAGLVEAAGLTFYPASEGIEQMLQNEEWRRTVDGGNFVVILRRMQAELKQRARELARKLPELLDGADLILTGMGGFGGPFAAAEKLNLPLVQAYVVPLEPTRAFPGPLTPALPFGRLLNPLSFHAARQMLWQSTRPGDVAAREVLGMERGSFFGPFKSLRRRWVPALYGYSRHVLPQPADWPAEHRVTGCWFLEPGTDWQPPADLVDFLAAGPPPIYIGFGSMGGQDPAAAGRIALEALALSGQRGVLAAGWGGLQVADLPETVHLIAGAPHTWLFPQMAAVVHHGGAGTTAAGLRAGVPSIVVPFMGDQPFWGRRVADLGVGPRPLPRKKLTGPQLAAAITRAVSDVEMGRRAAALGEKIRAEDGVGEAVAFVERFLAQRPG